MNKFSLKEIVEVELAGNWLKGEVIYLENDGVIEDEYQWMINQGLKGLCIRWIEKDIAFSILSINEDKSNLADYIQVENNFEEEIRKINNDTIARYMKS